MKFDFSKIINDFKQEGYSVLNNAIDEMKMLYLYAYYHYEYGDVDNIIDVCDGCDFKKSNNNKAQGFFETDESGEEELHILTTLYYENDSEFNINQAIYNISEIEQMIMQIKYGKYYTINTNESKLKDYYDSSSDIKIKIVVLTNVKLENENKLKIIDEIESLKSKLDFVNSTIVFYDDIIQEVEDTTCPKENVESANINVDSNNFMTYGEEKSLICNVSAMSLKTLYQKYSKSGLFAQNLRLYVKNGKVDEAIVNSIKNKGNQFWYLNNGIIIICDEYTINESKIELKNFSIINGGQTTRMIGETFFIKDFYILCKIIKNKYLDQKDKVQFVSEIAEASNSQKPIKATDLIANRIEQRMLKSNLEKEGIFCQIKRGENPINPKINYPLPWQKTKNDEIAQLIYSAIYQKPGSARNNKSDLCKKENIYRLIFDNEYSSKYIKDLLIIRSIYKKWIKYTSDDKDTNPVKKGLVKNGLFFMVAIIGLLSKLIYSHEYVELFKNAIGEDEKKRFYMSQLVFNHQMFKLDFNKIQKPLINLFNLAYERYYAKAYNLLKTIRPELAYSNFTKVDSNYFNYVMQFILDDFQYGIAPMLPPIIAELFYVETEEEKENTLKNVLEIEDAFNNKKNNNSEDENTLEEILKEKLIDFRTKTYKEKGIKAYEVFKNDELNLIVKTKPSSVEELIRFGCFQNHVKTKTRKYGESIVDIVNSVYKVKN